MTQIIQNIILAITGIIHMSAQGVFVLLILNKKISIKKLILFSVVFGTSDMITHSFLNFINPVLSLAVYILVMFVCLKFIFELKVAESVLGICLMLILSTMIQYSVVSVLKAIKYDLVARGSFSNQIIIFNIATLAIFAVTLIIYYLKLSIGMPENTSRSKIVAISANALVTAITIIPNIIFMENSNYSVPTSIIIFNLVSVSLLFILSIFNTIKRGELEISRQQIELQKLYISNMEEITNGLRGFKHDFNNIVQVMGGYIALDDMEGLKDYCKQMQRDCMTVNNRIPLNSFVKSDPAIYGLLLSKFTYSEVKNVSFRVNALSGIKLPKNGTYDFCKIIGILLDNAIEAAVESEKKFVEILIKQLNKDETMVEISNSFCGSINIEKIFENGYSTKEGHSGFGLWEIKKILSKYQKSSLSTSATGSVFIQRLNIKI